ncbi:DNA mismatch repair endonuclease MutL [Capnocytophaga canimorsus]|uniref:DNA mismatch repair endonuclease MutL n=1 Tax=Capnocytophaga canimorsus TaxID=28188 RepID=UPI001AC14C8E|nr:DNA mismatch repair endonuclease MutL [Capnocytophaga canimorsus]GIM58500.1 DNA mismatch repair protein MutL [Capnocytophaga canimorsus]
MTDVIRLLPDHVANQIAAGEVIQRPASAVKELLENAIDAQSTEIKLIIKDAGKTLVQVIDNGIGMSVTDARLAFERHATSKIQSAEDLFTLRTKGFRGEALASIAAIAHVEMITKRAADELATEIRVEGSKFTYQEPCVAGNGTSVAMKNLFFNIPARRNFLKSDSVELRHIIDEFHRVALAHPNIHFYMYNNGSELFNLPVSNFRQRVVNLFGVKTNEKLVPIEEETPVVKISGFVVKPEHVKKTKPLQFLLVNDRFIRSRYLNHAITLAYEGLLASQVQPEYFIRLEMNPATIDINIHPTKTEIKFEDEHTIYAMLKSAVKHALGQFNVMPTLDFEKDASIDIPYSYKEKLPVFPTISVDPNFNPFKAESKTNSPVGSYMKKSNPTWESIYSGLQEAVDTFEPQVVESRIFTEESYELQSANTKKIISFGKKYLITTLGQEVLIINISRAHQRVLYDEFLKKMEATCVASQQLMFPLEISFSKSDIERIMAMKSLFESIGFMFDIQQDSLLFTGIPLHVSDNEVADLFHELIANDEVIFTDQEEAQKIAFAKKISKSLAFRTGQNLTDEEQETLINRLFASSESLVSPFGKRIYTTLTSNDLDKYF